MVSDPPRALLKLSAPLGGGDLRRVQHAFWFLVTQAAGLRIPAAFGRGAGLVPTSQRGAAVPGHTFIGLRNAASTALLFLVVRRPSCSWLYPVTWLLPHATTR